MKKHWKIIVVSLLVILSISIYFIYNTCPVECSGSGEFRMCVDPISINAMSPNKCNSSASQWLNDFITGILFSTS